MAKQKTETKAKAKAKAKGAVKPDRAKLVRKELKVVKDNIETGFIDMAMLLAEAWHKEFHLQWGFETFEDYCNDELDVHYRKAMYLIDIYDKCKKYGLKKADVVKIGWTKMKDIAAVMTEKTAKQWLEKAKKMTTREVNEAVKTMRRKDAGTDVPTFTTMSFKMSEAEANVITESIEHAKKLCDSTNAVVALEMICQDWLADKGAVPERTKLADHVKFLEQAYGVKISHKKDAKKAKAAKAAKAKEKKEKVEKKSKERKKSGEESGIDDLTDSGVDDASDESLEELLGLEE